MAKKLKTKKTGRKAKPDYYISGFKAPIAWYGGKAYYAKWIISHFPEHRVFIEPFGGAANILLRKRRSEVEIYNDLDENVVNFFRVLRDKKKMQELVRLAELTPYSRKEFEDLIHMNPPKSDIKWAWWFYCRCRQAFGGVGMGTLRKKSWAMSTRTRRYMAEPVSKYLSTIESLPDIAERFQCVVIEKLPAAEIIKKYDGDDVLIYADPPYVPETRFKEKAETYNNEMTAAEHEELLKQLIKCRGKVILSGYESDLYKKMLKKWHRASRNGKAHISNSGEERIECLWMNFKPTL